MGNGAIDAFAFNRMNNGVVSAIAFGRININEITSKSVGTMESSFTSYIKFTILMGVAQGWRNEVEC
jgi:hypothetical protein